MSDCVLLLILESRQRVCLAGKYSGVLWNAHHLEYFREVRRQPERIYLLARCGGLDQNLDDQRNPMS